MTAKAESQKLIQSAIVELLEIRYSSLVMRFTNTRIDNGQSVIFDGFEFLPRQFEMDGYSISDGGVLPRPTLSIDNVDRYWYSVIRDNNDLKLADVFYRQVYADNLDGGSNPDPSEVLAEYEYEIRQRSAINPQNIVFTLGVAIDSETLLFGNQALKNTCPRDYRSPNLQSLDTFFDTNNTFTVDCPYVGTNYFKEDDTPTNNYTEDSCSRTLKACRLRFGENSELPFRGIPSIGNSRR